MSVQLQREKLQLQEIINQQRKELTELREFIAELRAESASRIDALEYALKARTLRMQNAASYLTCDGLHEQKIAMALKELQVKA